MTDEEKRKKVTKLLNPKVERQARIQRVQNGVLVLKGSQPYGYPWVTLSDIVKINLTGPRLGHKGTTVIEYPESNPVEVISVLFVDINNLSAQILRTRLTWWSVVSNHTSQKFVLRSSRISPITHRYDENRIR